ncbi:MAG TPA: hypothetical protein VFA21_10295 [Pyrinomonadaceae bacterium]|nr:hypothetical protein [Pyrinomonadaceae bacterium]
MRSRSRLLIAILLLSLPTTAALAQKRMCPKPPPSPFHHDGQIVTTLDGRAGGMRTTLEHPTPVGNGVETFYLAATFMHQDPRRGGAPSLDLILVSANPAARLQGSQDLVLVLDGQPHTLSRSVSYKSRPDGNGVQDSARMTLAYADAAALTHARTVVARVGGVEVALTNNHLEALRELVSLMAPSPSRWQTADASDVR